jgi:hypothetical protein
MMSDCERLQKALERIAQWAEAYPTSVFTPISMEQYAIADKLLRTARISMSSMHAQWARDLTQGIGTIARQALAEGKDG